MVTHIDQSYISQLLTAMEGETFLEKRGEGKDVGWQDFFVFVLFRLGGGGRDIQVIRVPPPPLYVPRHRSRTTKETFKKAKL